MGRDTSPFVVGDYWLDKRRDGKSDFWQIAGYSAASRSVVYRSTKRRELEDAKGVIIGFVEKQRAKAPQPAEAARVIPQLVLYFDEHGASARNSGQSASSMRAWIAFFMQDELGASVTVAQLSGPVFERFRRWRMNPHSYSVPWRGRTYSHASAGVKGETVQRNLDDLRAALNHAAAAGRVPYAPKVQSVKLEHRSPARDVTLSIDQLGAIIGFALWDKPTLRWLLLMLATACRPDAALTFDPAKQDRGDLLDTHPPVWPRTKKRNPVVPVIAPMRPILEAWKADPHKPARSRKTAWRTLRRALGLPASVVPKTIRHSIATQLRSRGVPAEEISGLLGHVGMNRTTAVYAKYDPAYLAKAKATLTAIFGEVLRAAESWAADHSRTKIGNGKTIVIDKRSAEAQIC